MEKVISQCEDIRHKLPASREALDLKTKELDKMKMELSKYDKPHLKQKIKDCEMSISQN